MSASRTLVAGACIFVVTAVATPGYSETTPAHVDTSAANGAVDYPTWLQDKGVQGTVVMQVRVTYSGRPTDVKFVQSTGNSDLDLAAENGVMNWHYIPASEDGEPVTDWATVRIDFKLPAPSVPAPSSTTTPLK